MKYTWIYISLRLKMPGDSSHLTFISQPLTICCTIQSDCAILIILNIWIGHYGIYCTQSTLIQTPVVSKYNFWKMSKFISFWRFVCNLQGSYSENEVIGILFNYRQIMSNIAKHFWQVHQNSSREKAFISICSISCDKFFNKW